MMPRFGAVSGSVWLGLIWAVWHLPLFFMAAGFRSFLVYSVGLSLLMTGVYLSTQRSILSGMLLHFTSNFTAQLLAPWTDQVEIVRAILVLVVGAVICVLAVRRSRAQAGRTAAEGTPA